MTTAPSGGGTPHYDLDDPNERYAAQVAAQEEAWRQADASRFNDDDPVEDPAATAVQEEVGAVGQSVNAAAAVVSSGDAARSPFDLQDPGVPVSESLVPAPEQLPEGSEFQTPQSRPPAESLSALVVPIPRTQRPVVAAPNQTPGPNAESALEVEQLRNAEARAAQPQEGEIATDTINAERLAREHGRDLRFCRAWTLWLVWDGCRWREDDTGEAERRAKATVRSIGAEALAETDGERRKAGLKWAIRSEDARRRDNMLRLAQVEPGIPVRPADLDRDQWLLNLLNGTLDLRTGELGPHKRSDLITKLAPVAYDTTATAPTFEAFLSRIMDGDLDLIAFLRRLAGYVLTGDVSAEVAFFLVGGGSNGKSTLFRVLQDLLGDYARSAPSDLLTGLDKGGATPERMMLKGCRLAICQETAEGKTLNAAAMKQITSRDMISARGLYKDQCEFDPTHKLLLSTNHKPRVHSTDEGTWRRIILVPFEVTIPLPDRDPHLLEKLRSEHPGILAWAVRGCREWLDGGAGLVGLAPPQKVIGATASYREAEDVLGAFVADACVRTLGGLVTKAELLAAYGRWAVENQEQALDAKSFNTHIASLPGIENHRTRDARYWRGIRLRPSGDACDGRDAVSGSTPPRTHGEES